MRTALVVHAHPDDEVFATGAATIALSDAGWRVVLRVATGGEASEDPALGEIAARRLRSEKLSRSCELLGIAEWGWLGEWVDRGGAGPGTVADEESAVLADAVRRALGEVRPELVLTVGSDGLTGHPDHVAIGAAVREAADGVLGARVRAADVAAAQDRLKKYAGERQVGSGRVVGVGDEVVLEEIPASGWGEVEERRRQALDVYRAGLGTLPLEDVIEQGGRLGDSVLLRAVLDVAGWDQDLFERG
ncbi:PIG-L deacetylase family protein [Kribbella sp. DT2]|uniref:PIG-L deacetylase family protein n=1 Tax=Kribbella sp. DT2 TaxID=3393427 RepID=UPI003CEEF291